MTPQEREKAVFHELDRKNYDQAIEHAKHSPVGWNVFERIASHPGVPEAWRAVAGGQYAGGFLHRQRRCGHAHPLPPGDQGQGW